MVTGGSLGLVLACDVVLVGTAATFRPWYATVGFAPDGGWTAMLPAVVGSQRTADVLLRDREIDAETAVAWGMASELVEGDVRAAARAVAARIAAAKRGAVGHVLGRLRGDVGSIAVGLEDERRRFVEQVVTAEAREGMAAFLGV
jgi:2-(1,2-epoxy-1,2-dihydrophenyl)acetyl-CoA isomerase